MSLDFARSRETGKRFLEQLDSAYPLGSVAVAFARYPKYT
jgi:hypothetical protein